MGGPFLTRSTQTGLTVTAGSVGLPWEAGVAAPSACPFVRQHLDGHLLLSSCVLDFIFYVFIFMHLLGCTGSWLWHSGSSIFLAARGIFSSCMQTLSCSMWELVPWPGIKPWPPALGAWSLSPWSQGNPTCILDFTCADSFVCGFTLPSPYVQPLFPHSLYLYLVRYLSFAQGLLLQDTLVDLLTPHYTVADLLSDIYQCNLMHELGWGSNPVLPAFPPRPCWSGKDPWGSGR